MHVNSHYQGIAVDCGQCRAQMGLDPEALVNGIARGQQPVTHQW